MPLGEVALRGPGVERPLGEEGLLDEAALKGPAVKREAHIIAWFCHQEKHALKTSRIENKKLYININGRMEINLLFLLINLIS